MNANVSSGQTARSASALGSKTPSASPEAASSVVESDPDRDSSTEDMNRLRADLAGLKDTLTRIASHLSGETAKTVRGATQTMASHVGDAVSGAVESGSMVASSAKERATTFASELERVARANPLGAIAGALLVGVLIGLMSRGRS